MQGGLELSLIPQRHTLCEVRELRDHHHHQTGQILIIVMMIYVVQNAFCLFFLHGWERSRKNFHYVKANRKHSVLTQKRTLSSVQPLSHVRLFATPRTAARQASLSVTNSQSLLRLMSIESVMPSNHLILCRPLLLPLSIFSSIRV